MQHNGKLEAMDNVTVVVRCRPLNQKEKAMGHKQSAIVDQTRGTITVNKLETPKKPPTTYKFDAVFGPDSNQLDIYNLSARPIVDTLLEGYNGTIFAYGQTGSGKTFTMEGVREVPRLRGIIPNSFAHILGCIAREEGDTRFVVRVSYLEIYTEKVWDLLCKDHLLLEVKEAPGIGIYVKNLMSCVVNTSEDLGWIMTQGNKHKATNMDEHSSRSHAIFTITIERCEKGLDGNQHVRKGKLHFVDLAGAERQDRAEATGQHRKEAIQINLALSTLGNVISALVENKRKHVTYRDSKLTHLLKDSLGGNAKTTMIAKIGPAEYNNGETIGTNGLTLDYANRAKNIQNKVRINEDPKDAHLCLQKNIEDPKKEQDEEIHKVRINEDPKDAHLCLQKNIEDPKKEQDEEIHKVRIKEDPKVARSCQFPKDIEDVKKKQDEGEDISGSEDMDAGKKLKKREQDLLADYNYELDEGEETSGSEGSGSEDMDAGDDGGGAGADAGNKLQEQLSALEKRVSDLMAMAAEQEKPDDKRENFLTRAIKFLKKFNLKKNPPNKIIKAGQRAAVSNVMCTVWMCSSGPSQASPLLVPPAHSTSTGCTSISSSCSVPQSSPRSPTAMPSCSMAAATPW